MSLGVDVHEAPLMMIGGGDPVAVRAKPFSVVHERQGDRTARMVEGHQVIHGIMQTRCCRQVPVFTEPISRRRHQQAGFIPMVHLTFIIADLVVELPGTCGKSDGVGNVQMRSDEVGVVAGESLPVAFPAAPAKPRIIHHVKMDLGGWRMQPRLGISEERASGTMRRGGDRDTARARDSGRVKKKMIDMQGAKTR
jgi:hypothetical protein